MTVKHTTSGFYDSRSLYFGDYDQPEGLKPLTQWNVCSFSHGALEPTNSKIICTANGSITSIQLF
jgi:hypothetical protein